MSVEVLFEIQRKRREEEHLYKNFEKYYRLRDFVKSSEFLWGSVAKIVYAMGLLFGKKVGRHNEIIGLIKELAKGDPVVTAGINSAESLHSNFYHNWMGEDIFEDYVRKVIDLRIWLIQLLDQETEKAIRSTP